MKPVDIARKLGISRERVRQILASEAICRACGRRMPKD
jgi:DNA-directed RNA polymerase sigma subunit (sigma70/sigma32)